MARDQRPHWIINSHIKDVDLHGCKTIELALERVQQTLATAKKNDNISYKLIAGRGTHSNVNQYGRTYKKSGNWKRDMKPMLFEAVLKCLEKVSNEFHVYTTPCNEKSTEVYVRFKSENNIKRKVTDQALLPPYISADLLPPEVKSDDEDDD
ncbi:unnamed protein product [Didymodactylos carnosus]|uniref:Smr domain-containing protein n=1 Tax=Didymodactylos carnosus TaxID=1234261 RepID=A0A814B6F1_9BILA|nr:unnamed protein product [Didymodactylos carnosus]CAF0925019.1 unnamed protein product [Didymodactylos carnosus]CAF3522765.1 unnamed protein product [Didymodactylos carnosus]CAF3703815.1 unnamed protein product [Didymodactylos carnosus]